MLKTQWIEDVDSAVLFFFFFLPAPTTRVRPAHRLILDLALGTDKRWAAVGKAIALSWFFCNINNSGASSPYIPSLLCLEGWPQAVSSSFERQCKIRASWGFTFLLGKPLIDWSVTTQKPLQWGWIERRTFKLPSDSSQTFPSGISHGLLPLLGPKPISVLLLRVLAFLGST